MLAAALCVAWRLSVDEQGFFFVFLSFGALLQLGDFGLSYAALQSASHFKAIEDNAGLAALRIRAAQINMISLSGTAVLVGVLGAVIFSSSGSGRDWLGPWLFFVASAWAAHIYNVEIALIEGGRSSIEAWRFRLVQEALSGCVFIAALIGGARLWSLGIYGITRAALATLWLLRARFRVAHCPQHEAQFEWAKEVWPFQWRIGLSALSGFLIFQAFNPIVMVEQDPSAAGKFGMSLAIMNMLLLVTTAWPISQAARYVTLIGQKDLRAAKHAFSRMLIMSSAFAASLAGGVYFALWWASYKGLPLADRASDMATTGLLLIAALVHHAVHCFAVILRAERREPLLPISVGGGVITVFLVWVLARYGNIYHIAVAYLACTVVGMLVVLWYYKHSAINQLSSNENINLRARA